MYGITEQIYQQKQKNISNTKQRLIYLMIFGLTDHEKTPEKQYV